MKKIITSIILCFCLCMQIEAFTVKAPEETKQGDFISVYFYGKKALSCAYAELIRPNGKVDQTVPAFAVDKQQRVFVAVIGIPTWAEEGQWQLKTVATEGKKPITGVQPLKIDKTQFEEYTMHLNESNTNLISKPDPKKAEEAKTLTGILTTQNDKLVAEPDYFIVPVNYKRITSEFAEKRTVIYNTGKKSSEVHWGVDFAVPIGTEVHSPADGVVVFSDTRILTGGTVVIEHAPGVYTLFYHLSKNIKAAGDAVKAGDLVALSGNTGYSTGPHLHWEFRINTVPVSPFSAVKKPLFESVK